jgi:hypothetical protein
MAGVNMPLQVDAVNALAQLAYSSPESFTLPTGSSVATASSSEPVLHRDASPSDSVRRSAESVHPSEQASWAPSEPSTPPGFSKLAPTISDPAPDSIHTIPGYVRPHTEAIQVPAHLARTSSELLAPHIDNELRPAGCTPAPIRTTSPLDGAQAEAVNSPVQLTHTLPTSVAPTGSAPNAGCFNPPSDVTRPQLETICPPFQPTPTPGPLLPPIESKPVPISGLPAPDRMPSSSGSAHSQVEAVRPLTQSTVSPSKPLILPRGSKTALVGIPASNMISPPLPLPRVEAARPLAQISRTLLESSASSIVVTCMPPHRNSSSIRARSPVEAPRPPVQLARVPPDPRIPSFGNRVGPANPAPQFDTRDHSSSRSRIKSHPKKMATPVGQRQTVPPLTVEQASQSMLRPVEKAATSLVQTSGNTVPIARQEKTSDSSYHTPLWKPSYPGTILEIRGEIFKSSASGQPTASQTASPTAPDGCAVNISASVTAKGGPRVSSHTTQEPPRQSQQATILPSQMARQLTARPLDQPTTRLVEQPLSSAALDKTNSAINTCQDRVAGMLPRSSPNLAILSEAQDGPKGPSVTPAIAPQTAAIAIAEQVGGGVAISSSALAGRPHHTSSMTRIKDSAGQPRQSTTAPEQPTSQSTVRSRSQSMIRLPEQYVTSPTSKRSGADSVAISRQGRTTEVLSHNSRPENPGIVEIPENRGDYKGHSLRSTVTASPPSAWHGTPRISSRIKTKDLINRHKPQTASDGRPLTISQHPQTHSPSKASTSGAAQIALLANKPGANRVDSGIELWDYEPRGDIHDGRSGLDASANRYCNSSNDRGSTSVPPTNQFAAASNAHREDGTGSSLPPKEPRRSISVSQTFPVVAAGSPSAGPPVVMPPRRREPFINRKPQPAFETMTTAQPEYSTPPRSSTPSSTSHSTSVTTSTQATVVTPATSFSLPSRGSSPPLKAAHRSWFQRIVIDSVKATLGYNS